MKFFNYSFFVVLTILSCSCANIKKVTYFNGLSDSLIAQQIEAIEPRIAKADILQITVSSLNPQASLIFNAPIVTGTGFGQSYNNNSPLGQGGGYLVTEEGMIQFPVLGSIKAEGMTKKALMTYITQQLLDKKLLVDPIVSVRQTNFHVTVLGEVRNPAVIPVPNERINVMEAIGLAGDLSIEAKRDNVLLIREEGGNKIIKRLNLNSPSVLSSPYYHLHSNDIIYVEPSKAKISSSSQGRQLLPLVISSLSVVVIVLDRILD